MSLEYSGDVKEEFQDECYPDNKVCASETTITDAINTSNGDMDRYTKNDKIIKYEMFSGNSNKDLPSYEVNDTISNNVKIENGICSADMQIEFHNAILFCNHCQEVYQDYCTKCRVLVHILNQIYSHTISNRIRELPKYTLEARESTGHLGIFTLKVIPEDVTFGPFTGLNFTGLSLRIKGGRFVVNDDKSEHLNWMQYINPARNIYEQNLFPFQYKYNLYYCSTRRIEKGEELSVYFGEEYNDNRLKNVEMDFVPIAQKNVENVFACTFCCLGFSLKEYLAEHKDACHNERNKMFSVDEITQCQFCKMYLEAKEYFEHHMDYCCETNDRYCILPSPEVRELEVERRSSEMHEGKTWKRGIYKCTQCKFTTMYNADFRHHTSEHYKVKMDKCGIYHRRYKAKEYLKPHVVENHVHNEKRDVQKYSTRDSFKANIKNIKEGYPHSHDGEKQCQSSKCEFQAKDKCRVKSLVEIKLLNRGKYKCTNCEFKTYYKCYLERHIKGKHLNQGDYKCGECEYKTSYKSNLKTHIKAKHLEQEDYKCIECEYKTNFKLGLENHIKAKHLKQKDYKCVECDYKTTRKLYLQVHIKGKHLKQKDYKCIKCEYETNYKACLERHIKAKHLKQKDYKCMECEYKTSRKSYLQVHVKGKHLKQKDYKCPECEFKTYFMSSLETHIKAKHLKQEDYRCADCEYKTNYKANLQIHIKAKHLKQDYKCVECEFKTYYKPSLEAHIKAKHLKLEDYKCMVCEYKTSNKSNLEKHVKAKHLKLEDCKMHRV